MLEVGGDSGDSYGDDSCCNPTNRSWCVVVIVVITRLTGDGDSYRGCGNSGWW